VSTGDFSEGHGLSVSVICPLSTHLYTVVPALAGKVRKVVQAAMAQSASIARCNFLFIDRISPFHRGGTGDPAARAHHLLAIAHRHSIRLPSAGLPKCETALQQSAVAEQTAVTPKVGGRKDVEHDEGSLPGWKL
jgi:hypothetical protein